MPKRDLFAPLDVLVVTPIEGEFGLRYYVSSRSDPDNPHIVDLSHHKGNGACDCPDFRARRWVAIKTGNRLFRPETLCVHLLAALFYYLEHVLPAHIELAKQTPAADNDDGP